MKFKVGDKVLFYFKAGPSTADPPLNTVHKIIKIIKILGLPEKYMYYYGLDSDQFFFEEEIRLANAYLIKEKLGIK